MKKNTLIFLLLTFSLLLSAVTEYYIQLDNISTDDMQKLTKIVSIDSYKAGKVVANAIDKELVKLDLLGFNYQIIPQTRKTVSTSSDLREVRDWNTYPTYEAYVEMMYQFASAYPEICTIHTIGNSVQDREVLVVKISDNVNSEEAEPASFYTGTMHGDETAGFVILLRLIDYITSNYGTDDRITNLVNETEIWINPASNPDGTYAGGNNSVQGATRRNANGVDLNRNYPDFEDGEHPDGEATQQENIDMMAFGTEYHMDISANFHGGTEVVNYPWDTIIDRHADDTWWQYVSHQYADNAQELSPDTYFDEYNDGTTNGYDWYSVAGGRQDWFNYYRGTKEFVLEISDEKLLDESELDEHWTWNKESLLLHLEEAMYGIRGTVTDSDGNPLEATITVLGHDNRNSHVTSRADFGDYYRPIEEGTFDLEFSAYGYISQVVENVSTTYGTTVVVNCSLEMAGNSDISGIITTVDTEEPLVGAEVTLLNTPYETVLTDESGAYQIPAVFHNNYEIKVYKDGYYTSINEITVSETSTTFDFALNISNAESFESGSFSEIWQFEGNAEWFIDSTTAYDGSLSARSGDINDNQSSTLKLELNVTESSTISFFKKVSSEDSSNDNYDFMTFSIDETEMGRWDGTTEWSQEEYNVTTGLHTLKWTYEKDNSVSSGSDCAWIDFVILPVYDSSSSTESNVPALQVLENYPNPFNPTTTISFSLNSKITENPEIMIYNIKGQRIVSLSAPMESECIEGRQEYSVTWNGTDGNNNPVASGIYYYTLKLNGKVKANNKMVLLK